MSGAKTAEPVEITFGVWTQMGRSHHILGGSLILREHLPARVADLRQNAYSWPLTNRASVLPLSSFLHSLSFRLLPFPPLSEVGPLFSLLSRPEMDRGWVHPWVGLGWVGLGRIFQHM